MSGEGSQRVEDGQKIATRNARRAKTAFQRGSLCFSEVLGADASKRRSSERAEHFAKPLCNDDHPESQEELMAELVADYLKKKYGERVNHVQKALEDFPFGRDSSEVLDCIIRRLANQEAGSELNDVLEEAESSDGQSGHAKAKFLSIANTCLEQLELLPMLSLILANAEVLYKAFLPQKLIWSEGWFKTVELELDKEGDDQTGSYGRYVYYGNTSGQPTLSTQLPQWQRPPGTEPLLSSDAELGLPGPSACIEWCSRSGGWVMKENGEEKFHLSAGLASDAGLWQSTSSSETDRLVNVRVSGKRVFSLNSLRELRECFARGLKVEEIVSQVQTACAGPFEEHKPLVQHINKMVQAMWEVASKLGLVEEEGLPSKISDLDTLFNTLVRLAGLQLEGELCELLTKKLVRFGEPELTAKVLERCKFWNERVLTVSDLHDVHMSYIPRFFHRLCHWSSRPAKTGRRHEQVGEVDDLRFIAISETHGWEWDLDLDVPTGQDGDVLLHCGNLLFNSGPTTRFGNPTRHLKDVLMVFDEPPFDKFKWILLIAGEHDKTLRELAEQNPRKLLNILPERVVFLRKQQDSGLEREPAARDPRLAAMLEGKVRLLRNSEQELKLAKPDQESENSCCVCCADAVVAAGGSNEVEADVIMTSGLTDELEEKLSHVMSAAKPHTRVVVGGQRNRVHEKGDRWHWSSVTSELLVPSRSPVFFDLPVCGAQLDDGLYTVLSRKLRQTWGSFFSSQSHSPGGAGDDAREQGEEEEQESSSSSSRVLPAEPLVANWIPRDFVARQTLDAHERKWAGAVRKEIRAHEKEWQRRRDTRVGAEVPEGDERDLLPRLFTCDWQEHTEEKLVDRLEKRRVKLDVPKAVWEESIWIKLTTENRWERMKAFQADEKSFPIDIHFEGDARDLWPRLFTCHRENQLEDKLEQWRVRLDVPKAVWKENVWIKLKTQHRWERMKAFRADEKSFPVDIHFPKKSRTNLSEYDVCGPAVLWSFQSVVHWVVAGFLPYMAYDTARDPAPGEAFAEYRPWLWLVFVGLCSHLWWVQRRCLKIIIMAQVHLMGSGFSIFGRRLSFRQWWWLMRGFSAFSLMDITAQCLFFGQFMRSVERNPAIPAVWKATIAESWESHWILVSNITQFFTVGWVLMFLQLLYMGLHMFVIGNSGIQYDMGSGESTGSMPQGYRTLASWLAWKLETGQETDDEWKQLGLICQLNSGSRTYWSTKLHLKLLRQDPRRLGSLWQTIRAYLQIRFKYSMHKQNQITFWHADILRVMASYGRMAAVMWSEQGLVKKRLEQELSQGKVNVARFYHIMYNRLKDFLSRVLLIEILEKGLKLEIQVTVFAIDLALQQDQSPTRPLNKQMRIAIVLSFLSAMYACWSHALNLVTLYRLHRRCQEENMKSGNWLNRRPTTRNQARVLWLLFWYAVWEIVLLGFIVHNGWKYVKAKECEFSMWNVGTGCVQFHWEGTKTNRTLILNLDDNMEATRDFAQ